MMDRRLPMWTLITSLVIISIATAACGGPQPIATQVSRPRHTLTTAAPTATPPATQQPPPTAPLATQQPPTTVPLATPIARPETKLAGLFAPYPAKAVRIPSVYQGYTLPVNPDQVINLSQFSFSAAQKELLLQNGFFVAPAEHREFFALYEQARYDEIPIFVTTDSVFHVYHLLFDKTLRTCEQKYFIPDLLNLTRSLRITAEEQYRTAVGTPVEDTAERVLAYFSVAQALLEPESTIPSQVADVVEAELSLIEAHWGFEPSPLLGEDYLEDYSQYVPRGHYTRSEDFKRYFKAMMWYGRINLRLKYTEETRMALLIVQTMNNTQIDGEPALTIWERLYEPTAFFVGKTDDLSIMDYSGIIEEIYGSLESDPTIFADEGKLHAFIEAARQLPPPQINSMWVWIWEDREETTQGFRFMGQRFVIDAYIFQQLIFRNVGTLAHPRLFPKGLDIFAAMGSEEAYHLLDEMGETEYANYVRQAEKVRQEIANLETDSWTQNLYWSWLYAFQPVIAVKGESYPAFMRTIAWQRKDLQTALGSWTELKHDTILYAKQAYAEMGGGPEESPPKGYVEPVPEVYARLAALTTMTREGLSSRGLLDPQDGESLQRLGTLLNRLQAIAEEELAGEPLSEDDVDFIRYYGGQLEMLTMAAADTEDQEEGRLFLEDEEAAIVADVATAGPVVLEEGTGRIFEIFVVVEVDGRPQITKGGVFSYYEFLQPASKRLTDETWRQMLDQGNIPPRPEWTNAFIAE